MSVPPLPTSPALLPELYPLIAQRAHPITSRSLRQTNKAFSKLVTMDDLIWGEAGWRHSRYGLNRCWDWALNNGHERVVRAYLGDVSEDDRGRALSIASGAGHISVVKELLDAGTDVHWNGEAALHSAAHGGYAQMVKVLLGAGALHSNTDDEFGAIITAVWQGHTEVVKVFMGCGEDMSAYLEMALRDAASEGHQDIVRTLLGGGATIHARDGVGLVEAAARGHFSIVKMLLEAGADGNEDTAYDALRYAIGRGDAPTVEVLLEGGRNVGPANRVAWLVVECPSDGVQAAFRNAGVALYKMPPVGFGIGDDSD
ncbi:hypothetical protein HDV00_005611 [Rhizophlyctis rosea]|nr:hypothetical protein HDV00_005611 [Rhizophlyctis rosea]